MGAAPGERMSERAAPAAATARSSFDPRAVQHNWGR